MSLDGWLVAVCVARTFGMFVFMSYAAVLPVLREAWGMSATEAGSVSTAFQIGYALSLMVFSWVADRAGARRVFVWSAAFSALAAVTFAAFARSYVWGLLLYSLVAISQGGTYTTAIMLFADRYPPQRRGAAVGWLIASSSLGYALSLLVSGVALRLGGYPLAFAATAAGPVIGLGLLLGALRSTPNVIHERRAGLRFAAEVLRNRRAMRLMAGYTAHSWELLGMWAWTPAFVAAALALGGLGNVTSTERGAYLTAAFHVMGLVSSWSMGGLSDRFGRRVMLVSLAATSTACSFIFGWLIAGPLALIFVIGAVYLDAREKRQGCAHQK
ncbi:MAG: MFS transporter [Candidatus Rokubacteria bacterium]|nr:MFS transporter [Candidatus Rokubacteria bacterium]MBI3825064.1 MFS transporter [Candidatus Rokubacteria bacterium]